MSRNAMLSRIRTALGRDRNNAVPPPPPVRLSPVNRGIDHRVHMLLSNVERLGARPYLASTESEARDFVLQIVAGRSALSSNSAALQRIGLESSPNIAGRIHDPALSRQLAASVAVGITGADYALADTGSLVLFSSREEARLISLLPPVHVAVVLRERILDGLDELLTMVPQPSQVSSSMVLITGTSRTADIEQILVRGVHGPGEVHVIVV